MLWQPAPGLARLPLELIDRLAPLRLRPLAVLVGRRRHRIGFVAQHSAEETAQFHMLQQTVRETALERSAPSGG